MRACRAMDVRTIVGLLGGLGLAAALFAIAARLKRSAQRRAIDAIDTLIASMNAGAAYRSPANTIELQGATREDGPDGPRLRFAYLEQRALLDFTWPRTVAASTFGDFELGPGAYTLLRFWIHPAQRASFPPDGTQLTTQLFAEDPFRRLETGKRAPSFGPDAQPHLDALAQLVPNIRLATREDGLFVVADGVLGISLEHEKLVSFVEHVCALVRLHLDDRLFA